MYRKIVWCYVFILTLLDISLNTKLSAQGKSHGVTVHDSLIEGITFQEWGKESVGEGRAGGGRAVSAGALALSPPALEFGRAALAAAHALTVTLTNTANTTMHLASVAGTTPDFHASFFESKTLPPQANTTFSVVYLGRREGPVSAHLYIHTSLGVHKYPVSAVGVASEWGVWPLVGVRVPLNATIEPLLTMHNPTDHTIQVSEVYSSGAWLGLQLPDGGESAPRGVWALPPRATRPLVRLRLTPPHHAAPAAHTHTHTHTHTHQHPLTAYIRIKANITGGGLVVCVEARPAPPGEYASPLQLRLMTRGSQDPADVLDIAAGNSAGAGVALDASVWAARCAATPPAPNAPPPHTAPPTHNGETKGTANGNGVKSEGVYVSLVRSHLEPHQPLTHAAQLTFDYARMWAGYGGSNNEAEGAWCGGWLTLGRAALPYSVRLLPGTLRLVPATAHFVTANRDEALIPRDLRARNEFPVPVHVAQIDFGPDVEKYFEVDIKAPLVIRAHDVAVVARVRLRARALGATLRTHVTLRTNVTEYALPLLLYSGRLDVEWEWPHSADALRLGALGASSTRRVRLALHNRGVVPLCVRELRVALAGAQLALAACGAALPPPHHECRCVAPGHSARGLLTVVAPAREGAHRGYVQLTAAPPDLEGFAATTRVPVELSAHHGRLHVHPITLHRAAPYVWSSAALVLESTMALTMRVTHVALPPDNPALSYVPGKQDDEISTGKHSVGTLVYAAEKLCEPNCYTGLDINTPEGAAWLRRSGAAEAEREAALRLDAQQLAARYAVFVAGGVRNVSLLVHTSRVLQLAAAGGAAPWWPRVAEPAPAAAGLAPVGGQAAFRVRAANPSSSHPLLLQPVVAGAVDGLAVSTESAACRADSCVWARGAFRLLGWRAARGSVTLWRAPPDSAPAAGSGAEPGADPGAGSGAGPGADPGAGPGADPGAGSGAGSGAAQNATDALPMLLLAPDAEVELKLSFAPKEPAPLTAYLYLRNNLTIMEGVQLSGRGAYPSFELGGRRPGTNTPLLFEVSECAAGGATVRRTLVARNTGRVRVRLREWRVAGEPCQARGWRLAPCAPLSLAPNESRPLTLAFTPDWTLARVAATLELRSELGRASFPLQAAAPARLLPRCAAAAPRPAWEPALRAAGSLLALAALALVLAAAALDAERELRRARANRPPPAPPAPRQPLDLRALANAPQQAPPPPVARRAPARRRRAPRPAVDPAAERRAFERWRHEVLRRPDDDDERSSEDNELTPPAPAAPAPPPPAPAAPDGYDADPESEERRPSGDDDNASTGSGSASASSSPTADVDEPDDDEPAEPRARAPPPPGEHDAPRRAAGPPSDVTVRPARQRRDTSETPRRSDRTRPFDGTEAGSRSRPTTAKHHTRKDKVSKRRTGERPPASPPRSPPRSADSRAPGALRWGASWSSVVAARGGNGSTGSGAGPAPLAPIGSDVRRRAEPAPADHSLFYFNGDPTHTAPREPDFTWRPPPQVERPTFSPSRDFLDEPAGVGNGSFRSLNSVWGSSLEPRPAAAAWLWGGFGADAAVRPPPGFGTAARGVRPYDPFRSLASIWAPGALDWRADGPSPAPGAPPSPPGPGPAPDEPTQ